MGIDSVFSCSYRSDGASSSEARRIRRRSISITPEIGDDIVRLIIVPLSSRCWLVSLWTVLSSQIWLNYLYYLLLIHYLMIGCIFCFKLFEWVGTYLFIFFLLLWFFLPGYVDDSGFSCLSVGLMYLDLQSIHTNIHIFPSMLYSFEMCLTLDWPVWHFYWNCNILCITCDSTILFQ